MQSNFQKLTETSEDLKMKEHANCFCHTHKRDYFARAS